MANDRGSGAVALDQAAIISSLDVEHGLSDTVSLLCLHGEWLDGEIGFTQCYREDRIDLFSRPGERFFGGRRQAAAARQAGSARERKKAETDTSIGFRVQRRSPSRAVRPGR